MKLIYRDGQTIVLTHGPIACPRCGRAAEPTRDTTPTWWCRACDGLWQRGRGSVADEPSAYGTTDTSEAV